MKYTDSSSSFRVYIDVTATVIDWEEFSAWGLEHEISMCLSLGRLYFYSEEDLLMFRLKFPV